MNRRLSIIIPTYNSILYLRTTVYSILQQEGCDIELIVVDSGSTDGTLEFCSRYAQKVLYCPPGNMYTAINMGIAAASYDLVTYINSDDYFNADVLDPYLRFIEEKSADFAYSLGDFVDAGGMFRSSLYTPKPENLLLYFNSGVMPFLQPSTIFRKALFEKLDGFNDEVFRFCADFDFFFSVVRSSVNIVYYPKRTVCFRVSATQLGNVFHDNMKNELWKIVRSRSDFNWWTICFVRNYYRFRNLANILMRSIRRFQLKGKFSIVRALQP